MAHACNLSTLGGWGGWITWGQEFQTSLTNMEVSLLKIQNISQVWWCMPVIPATQEAEAEEALEPRRRRLQSAKTAPLHFSLGNRVRLRPNNNKKRKITKKKAEAIQILPQRQPLLIIMWMRAFLCTWELLEDVVKSFIYNSPAPAHLTLKMCLLKLQLGVQYLSKKYI